jgi:hypothetical protein
LFNGASSWDGPARDPGETPDFSAPAIDHLREEYYERGRGTSRIHNSQSNSHRRTHSQPAYRPDLTNFQHGSLTQELRDAAFDRLAEASRAQCKGEAVYEPTDNEILTEYHKLLRSRPYYAGTTGAMSKKKLKDFRMYLRYKCFWLVSMVRIYRIVRRKLKFVTTGLIPVIDTTSAPRKENYHSRLEKVKSFKQETSNAVRVTLRLDPDFKSLVKIAHTINYENPDTPDVQPKEVAYVELTHRNTRIPKLSDDGAEAWDLDVYRPSHKVLDVSNRTWESTLRKLFPQTSTQKNYFKDLYGSLRFGVQLFLICFRHNELPCTSNVLTHRKHMPEVCDDLRIVMQNSPYIFMLIRGSGVDSQVESIVEAWKELTEYDPMSVIYKDLNPQMCDSGIKPTSELPKFTASARYVFETLEEYERSVGLGTLLEQRASMGKHTYTGRVEEECKRLMDNIAQLKVSHRLRDTYPAKAAALKAQTELLLMKNFAQLKSSELFKDIDAGQWGQARQILISYLQDYQLNAFTEMEDNGLYENTACGTGPSGSGKSYLAFVIAVAYTLDIKVPDSQIE